MLPHSGAGTGTPRPRKLSDDVAMIADAILSVIWTIIGDMQFGITWKAMILASDIPVAFRASTYS